MKAILVRQLTAASLVDMMRGNGFYVKRLVIAERDNLTITVVEDQIFAIFDFKIKENCEILGEVEVPMALVEMATALAMAKEKMEESLEQFRGLMEG